MFPSAPEVNCSDSFTEQSCKLVVGTSRTFLAPCLAATSTTLVSCRVVYTLGVGGAQIHHLECRGFKKRGPKPNWDIWTEPKPTPRITGSSQGLAKNLSIHFLLLPKSRMRGSYIWGSYTSPWNLVLRFLSIKTGRLCPSRNTSDVLGVCSEWLSCKWLQCLVLTLLSC